MREREEFGEDWWLLSVLAAMALGWWLAVRTLALRIGEVTAAMVPALPAPEPLREAVPGALPMPRLEDRVGEYLTVKELVPYLHLCEKMLREEIKEGRLIAHRMRGKLMVKGSDALAWLSARREG